ncbi:hypothetical protein WA026_020882 [Henosepilachna vigintioctopunctata]|uniref:Uncharacterized protein n=1 Tax=Henosepilachna vigintioctopunctata TaxID=420089 RepID=A0AAW1UMD7_9CUCU
MSIIKFTRNTLYQIGIPYVLLGSDKLHSTNREKLLVKSDLEPVTQVFLSSPTKINNSDRQLKKHYYTHNLCEYWCMVLGSHRLSNIAFEIRELHCLVTRVLKTLILCALFAWIYLQESGDYFHEKNNCCVVQVNVKFTVKSLHAGTLVTCWTTAPRKPFLYKRLAQLASILFLFFILSIVTQCYSSTYATKPELELAKPLSNLSPTLNSRIHSSSIILSRIIQAHFVEKEVPHYHHVLLHLVGRRKRELTKHNLNHISEENFIPKTRKRVHVKVKEIGDKSYLNRIRGKSERKTQRSESAERTEILTQRQNGENFSDFVSVTGNFSRVISQKLNQSNFGVGSSDKQIFQEKTAQPMPPAYGHTDNSCEFKFYI